MIVLDTNVLSSLMRQQPEQCVIDWLDKQPRPSVWISSITILEVKFGLQVLPASKKRTQLGIAFEALLKEFGYRIAVFDMSAAQHAADIMTERKKNGKSVELRDTMIAGIVMAHRASLATRNVQHFDDLSLRLINPWKL